MSGRRSARRSGRSSRSRDERRSHGRSPMTFPLTEPAQTLLSLARREARRLNHEYVGTEHVLLALLIDRPLALAGLGVATQAVHDEIDKLVTRGPAAVTQAELPLTPRARRVLDHAE